MVTGIIEFLPRERPHGAFTVTVLVEDVSRADAPSIILGSARFENPAFTGTDVAELPFAVTVPTRALTGIRRVNLRVHVREGVREGVRERPDLAAQDLAEPDMTRPNVAEGDFVSTQSHPVTFESVSSEREAPGSASVRIPVLRV